MKISFKTVVFLMIFPTTTFAEDWTGLYGGISVGHGQGTVGVFGSPTDYDLEGNVRGAFVGYNVQSQNLVYGAELSYQSGNVYLVPTTTQGMDRIVDFKGRLGYAAGRALFYGVLGYTSNNFFVNDNDSSGDGVAYGVGVDYKFGDRAFVGAEYLQRDMHNDAASSIFELEPEVSTLSIRLGMTF